MSEFIEQDSAAGSKPTGAIVSRAKKPETAMAPAEPTSGLGLFGGAPEPGGPPAGGGFRFSPTQLLQYKWSILGVFLLIAVPASALIWTLTVPAYRSSAEIRVRPIIPQLVFRTEENGMIPLYQSYMNTQVSVIRSPSVLQRVLDRKDVQETHWYTGESASLLPQPERSPLERLKESLTVRPRIRTEVIDVAFTCQKGGDAAVIANAVLEEYMKHVNNMAVQTGDKIYRTILEQKNTLESEIASRQGIVDKLRRELGTGTPEELVAQKRLRLDNSEADVASLDYELDALRWHIKQMERSQQNAAQNGAPDVSPPPASQPTSLQYAADGEWKQLHSELTTAKTTIELKSNILGDKHPAMVELRKRVELTEGLLKARQQQLDQHWVMNPGTLPGAANQGTSIVGSAQDLARQIEFLKYRRGILVTRVEQQKKAFQQTFDKAQMLLKEIQGIKHKEGIYRSVRTRLDEKEMERNVPGSIEILARAFKPSRPDKDRRVVMTVLSVLGGLGVALGVALIRTNTSPSFHQADELGQMIRAPFLGQVPLLENVTDADIEASPLISEYIRMVRTVLTERLNSHQGNVVQITGATPGSGKTTIAIQLAKSFAQCGKRVLLVDGDLRNPTVSRRMNVDIEPGLMGTLAQRATADQAIVRTDTPGLNVMPAGIPTCEADAEMLGNGVFSSCLDRWRQEYDVVLLDSPPALQAADARILSRQADGTVMVVREGYCRRADVSDALSYLLRSGATFLGTIFLGSQNHRADYYGYGYGYGYGYEKKPKHALAAPTQGATEAAT